MDISKIRIVGTSHISSDSVAAVASAFDEFSPDIVAVELDHRRLHALFSRQKQSFSFSDARRVGFKGYMFAMVGSFLQQKLGDYLGTKPGAEMKKAIILCRARRLELALIDQDIELTLKRFSKYFSWKEKFQLIKDIACAPFSKEKIDISQVPEQVLIDRMMDELKVKYPNIHRVLVEERNHVMADNLRSISGKFPDKKVLAVMGAGHVNEVTQLLSK